MTLSPMMKGYLEAAKRVELEIGPPEGKCLDVGCGDGDGMALLSTRWPKSKWVGLEVCGAFCKEAAGKGLSVKCCDLAEYLEPGVFSFVFSRHSLEHMSSITIALATIAENLKEGGKVYFQVPIEKRGTKNPLHLSPFSDSKMARLTLLDFFKEIYWGPQPEVIEFIGEKKGASSV